MRSGSVVLGTLAQVKQKFPEIALPAGLTGDAYFLKAVMLRRRHLFLITSATPRGVLYGAFAWIRHAADGDDLETLAETSPPAKTVRWVNQWDNLDGTIERGYGGRSIFFEKNNVNADLTRASQYARLLASIGINGCTVNNVNANPRALTHGISPADCAHCRCLSPLGCEAFFVGRFRQSQDHRRS